MKTIPHIADAEWSVMKVLWERSPLTANDIVESLGSSTDWKPKTVKTLISRLLKKGVLGFHEEGRIYRYYPIYSESECIRVESESFVKKIYGGSFQGLVAALMKDQKLSGNEIDELRKILDQKENRPS